MKQVDYSKASIINCPICDCKRFKTVTMRIDGSRIVRCLNCQHVYLNPCIDKKTLGEIYDKLYFGDVSLIEKDIGFILQMDNYFFDPKGPYQNALNWLLQHGGLQGKKILDIGCGSGRFLAECAKYGAYVQGVDASRNAVEVAKRYYDIEVVHGYWEFVGQLGLLKKSFYDIIVSFEVIEHVPRPIDFFKTIRTFIKNGGYLILSTPNFFLFELQGLSYEGIKNYAEHLHFYEPEGLVKILEKCGFEILLVTTGGNLWYGDRMKLKLANLNLVHRIWHKVRIIGFIYLIKNVFFLLMNKIKTKEDKLNLNGRHILCIARKHHFKNGDNL